MSKKVFEQGEVIFRQGDVGETMYSIYSGSVGVYVNYGTAAEKQLTVLEAGKYFGEMAVIDNMPRSATLVALEKTEVIEYTKETYMDFLTNNPLVCIGMMSNLSDRLRRLTADYMDACKAISEMVEEDRKPAKKGLWERLRHYANVYSEAVSTAYSYTGEGGRTTMPYHSDYFGDMWF